MWWALTNTSFTKDEKETFINIAGSYIVYRVTDAGEPRMPKVIDPMNDDAFALLIGNAPGASADKVKISWWKCVDADCINMDPTGNVEVTPFTSIVENRLYRHSEQTCHVHRVDECRDRLHQHDELCRYGRC